MTHGHRILKHWNQWLTHQFLGQRLLEEEQQLLSHLLKRHFGKHALLIGVPQQHALLQSTLIPCHTLISPLLPHEKLAGQIDSDFHELPILTGSIDLVMLPHTLEYVDNPRQLLAEACRVVKPEGLIVITGFNPYSLWGFKKPWTGHFINMGIIKSWLRLVDFAFEEERGFLFRPPINHQKVYDKLHFVESVGRKCFTSLGGAYMLIARAKVIPLTPIRLKWKQQLSHIGISTTMTGHIARHQEPSL